MFGIPTTKLMNYNQDIQDSSQSPNYIGDCDESKLGISKPVHIFKFVLSLFILPVISESKDPFEHAVGLK